MRAAGILLLINVVIVAVYFLSQGTEAKRVVTLSAIGIVVGGLLIAGERWTKLKLPGGFELTAVVQQATADAEAISELRKETEAKFNMAARDAEAARTELGKIEKLLGEAQKEVGELKDQSSFHNLVLRTQLDDRLSFDKILKIAKEDGPFKPIAIELTNQIAFSAEPSNSFLIEYKVDWEKHGVNLKTSNLDELGTAYNKLSALQRPTALREVFAEQRFPLRHRLEIIYTLLKKEASTRALGTACDLMNSEAKLDLNINGYPKYQEWWEANREKYEGK